MTGNKKSNWGYHSHWGFKPGTKEAKEMVKQYDKRNISKIAWKKQTTPTYESWMSEWKNHHNTRRVARISLSKAVGRKPYGVSVEAWTNLNKTKDMVSFKHTYRDAKAKVREYKKDVSEMWGKTR